MGKFLGIFGKDDKREQAERLQKELSDLRELWKPYLLGASIDDFRSKIESWRRETNLHFAQKCRMRMIPASAINWHIVDEYGYREMRKYKPHYSYVNVTTAFYCRGTYVNAAFGLSSPGKASLRWDGKDPVERFETVQEMIRSIDERI